MFFQILYLKRKIQIIPTGEIPTIHLRLHRNVHKFYNRINLDFRIRNPLLQSGDDTRNLAIMNV